MLHEEKISQFEHFIYDNFHLINELCDAELFSYLTFNIYTDTELFIYVTLCYERDKNIYVEIDTNFFVDSSFMSNIHEKEVSMKLKRYYKTCQLLLN